MDYDMADKQKYNPKIHHRRSIRLKGYDYSKEGLYYITICIKNRKCLFGEIVNDLMVPNDAGKMVEFQWLALITRYPNIKLHEYVVMPNHFHGILEIVGVTPVVVPLVVAQNRISPPIVESQMGNSYSGQPQGIAPTDIENLGDVPKNKTLCDMMDAFKSIVSVEYIRGVKTNPCCCSIQTKCSCGGWKPFVGKLLQRNYWEHIIRNEFIVSSDFGIHY